VLVAPKGQNTRPTADRIKENLFNIISAHIPGARFLDLFCGSGAIGIEALSRGASEAVFVDISKDAVSATMANLTRVRFSHRSKVLRMSVCEAISKLKQENREFDIIFLDPPYNENLFGETLDALGASNLLSADGIIIAEYGADDSKPEAEHLILYDEREYGGTKIALFKGNV